jgi:hypothetical protein
MLYEGTEVLLSTNFMYLIFNGILNEAIILDNNILTTLLRSLWNKNVISEFYTRNI